MSEKLTTTRNQLKPGKGLYGTLDKIGWGSAVSDLSVEVDTLIAILNRQATNDGLPSIPTGLQYVESGPFRGIGRDSFYAATQVKLANGCGDTTTIAFSPQGTHDRLRFTAGDCENAAPALMVIRPNIQQEFARRYYNALTGRAKFLRAAGHQAVDSSYAQLADIVALVDSLTTEINLRRVIFSPCEPLLDSLVSLNARADTESLKDNVFFDSLMKDWLLSSLWLTGGELRLNPLPFTDDEFLLVKEGHDQEKARLFDTYVDNSISSMLSEPQLSGVQPNYVLMDSLLTLRGTGAVRYTYDKYNDSIKRINNTLRLRHRNTLSTAHEVSFALLPGKQSYSRPLVFDAAQRLRKTGNRPLPPAMAYKDRGYLIVTNISTPQKVTITSTSKSATDESSAMRGISQVAGLAGAMFSQGGALGAVLTQLNDSFRKQSGPNVPGREVPVDADILDGDGITDADDVESASPLEYFSDRNKAVSPLFAKFRWHYFQNGYDSIVIRQLNDSIVAQKGLSLLGCGELAGFPHDDIIDALVRDCGSDDNLAACMQVVFPLYQEGLIPVRIEEFIENLSPTRLAAYKRKISQQINEFSDLQQVISQWADYVRRFAPPSKRILPPDTLASNTNPTPVFRNKIYPLKPASATEEHSLALTLIEGKKDTLARSSHTYKTSPGHRVSVSFGPSFTFNKDFERIEAKESDGAIVTEVDDNQLRITSGLHLHLAPLINTNDAFITSSLLSTRDKWSRFSVYLGLSFPQPLHNLHLGLSVEPWPGVRLIGGHHWYRSTDYSIVNNQILAEDYEYKGAGWFLSLNFPPTVVTSLIGIFN
ncbi:hypothetical protein GGR28_002043 [Lewinella aquimaris]|uniref:Uncharacterized protein n=1 Tax=Neolewinella aquimaris TaxID=1835722 RepID=A0A840E644_9BACT|nr:hypothetical protein [Neolewinella aquimaris]MBB4079423.1 hypothetical protein [Neolewinella aquimaris]